MAINTPKVLVGGIAAGVVLTATDVLSQVLVLGDRMEAELAVAAPGMATRMTTPGAIATFIVMNFVFGIAIAWLYAAIRPRFGAGMSTAAYAGVFLWFIGSLLYSSWMIGGLMSGGTYALSTAIWLIGLVVAALAAGALYKEETPVAATTR